MKINVGGMDRTIRLILGVVLIVLSLAHVLTGGLAIAAYLVGAIALITGFVRFCPAYTLVGLNTSSVKPTQPK